MNVNINSSFRSASVPNDSSKLGYHNDTIINKNSHYSDINILSFRGKQKKRLRQYCIYISSYFGYRYQFYSRTVHTCRSS